MMLWAKSGVDMSSPDIQQQMAAQWARVDTKGTGVVTRVEFVEVQKLALRQQHDQVEAAKQTAAVKKAKEEVPAKAQQAVAAMSSDVERELDAKWTAQSLKIFDSFDAEKKGVLLKEDHEALWAKSGVDMSSPDIQQQMAAQWARVDTKGTGVVTRVEFVEVQKLALRQQHGQVEAAKNAAAAKTATTEAEKNTTKNPTMRGAKASPKTKHQRRRSSASATKRKSSSLKDEERKDEETKEEETKEEETKEEETKEEEAKEEETKEELVSRSLEAKLTAQSEKSFDRFDKLKKGFITQEDYESLWIKYYTKKDGAVSTEQMQRITEQWKLMDVKETGLLTREDFVELHKHSMRQQLKLKKQKARSEKARAEKAKAETEKKVFAKERKESFFRREQEREKKTESTYVSPQSEERDLRRAIELSKQDSPASVGTRRTRRPSASRPSGKSADLGFLAAAACSTKASGESYRAIQLAGETEESKAPEEEEDAALRTAIELSKKQDSFKLRPSSAASSVTAPAEAITAPQEEEDAELKRAIELSKQESFRLRPSSASQQQGSAESAATMATVEAMEQATVGGSSDSLTPEQQTKLEELQQLMGAMGYGVEDCRKAMVRSAWSSQEASQWVFENCQPSS
jgi:hypothetical protein